MRITIVSVPVQDQQHALEFYSEKLGFVKKHDIPLGGGNRWLTLVSGEDPKGPELLLEPAPNHFEPSKAYQEALFDAGIPWTQFDVSDIQAAYDRLVAKGVKFTSKPKDIGTAKYAVFDDTCGNLIQIVQMLNIASGE